jgi:type I restriction-modification system DNA methylase subunit
MYNEIQPIVKELEKVSYGQSRFQIFEDFLDAMISALCGNEEKYMSIVERHKDGEKGSRGIDHFCKAFGQLIIAMGQRNNELLGEIYMEWNISNKHTGQFFTPSSIADLMASIVGNNGNRVNDPSCGSGVMLVACLKQKTSEQLAEAVFVGQDLDATCVKMCALNMCFFNVNSFVYHCNTLSMECYGGYATQRTPLGGAIRELTEEEWKSVKIEKGQMALI